MARYKLEGESDGNLGIYLQVARFSAGSVDRQHPGAGISESGACLGNPAWHPGSPKNPRFVQEMENPTPRDEWNEATIASVGEMSLAHSQMAEGLPR